MTLTFSVFLVACADAPLRYELEMAIIGDFPLRRGPVLIDKGAYVTFFDAPVGTASSVVCSGQLPDSDVAVLRGYYKHDLMALPEYSAPSPGNIEVIIRDVPISTSIDHVQQRSFIVGGLDEEPEPLPELTTFLYDDLLPRMVLEHCESIEQASY